MAFSDVSSALSQVYCRMAPRVARPSSLQYATRSVVGLFFFIADYALELHPPGHDSKNRSLGAEPSLRRLQNAADGGPYTDPPSSPLSITS